MATSKQIRNRGRWSLIIGAVLAALMLGAVAYADQGQADNDLGSPGNQNTVNLTANPGDPVSTSLQVVVNYSGSKHLTASQTVTYSVSSTTLPSGYTAGHAAVAIPSDWGTATTASATSGVSFTAPATPGDYSYTVQYDPGTAGTDYTCVSSPCLTGNPTFTVNLHVNTVATNHPPNDPGAPYLDGFSATPNNTGSFTVDWAPSTDPDTGDTVTYELQKHDASTSNWTSVQSGLTTNSYAFSNENEGSWTYRVQASDNHGATSNWAEDSSAIVVVDKTAPYAPTAAATTSPVYTDGSGHNWWMDTVTVGFTANGDPNLEDGSPGSGVKASTLTGDQTFTTLGLHTASGTVQDNAGNTSDAATLDVYVDDSKPVVTLTCPSSSLILGSSVTASWSATDTGSGVATGYDSGSIGIDTSTVGSHTAQVAAGASQDNVGHSSDVSNSCTYTVVYDWHGFFQPVDNPTTFNVVKAGQGVPVKFDLGGNQGLNIFASGYPKSTVVPCTATSGTDTLEETVTAGNSSLNYDPTVNPPIGQYVYVWKTDKGWAKSCRRLDVKLMDGTTHSANFNFTK